MTSPPAQRRHPTADGGFTLLELIIVIAVIGILATIAMPSLVDMPKRAAEVALKVDLHTLRDVIDQYYADRGSFPASLETLVESGYLRGIPRDPITRSTDTWVVIYEEFDPEAMPAETDLPEGGAPGVVDVHSGAEGLSLDGVTYYSEW